MFIRTLLTGRFRRSVFGVICSVVAAAGVHGNASAAWPADGPIRIIVPQAAGGTNDIVARLYAAELTTRLGQSVIVENRPGAASAIGMKQVARSKPDGYTLGLASDSASLLDAMQPKKDWTFKTELRGVAMIGDQPISISVPAQSAVRSVADLVAAARAKPGAIVFGSSGVGSSQHLVGEWLGLLAGVQLTHVPYKGGGQASLALVSGELPMAVLGVAPMLALHQQGKARVIAVTSGERDPALPDVPTLTEAGYPQIALSQWAGLVAPASTPDELIRRLAVEIVAIGNEASMRAQLAKRGITARPMSDAAFDRFLKKTVSDWEGLIPRLDLPLDR
jgi:tripartite-type tricarboxylate transporter receptor subunit TctC